MTSWTHGNDRNSGVLGERGWDGHRWQVIPAVFVVKKLFLHTVPQQFGINHVFTSTDTGSPGDRELRRAVRLWRIFRTFTRRRSALPRFLGIALGERVNKRPCVYPARSARLGNHLFRLIDMSIP